MNTVQEFFLFCSGATPSILKRSPSDVNKFVGIGATVFFTGLLAFISAGFAIHTIFDSYTAAILFGLVWGLMIFNLDRYIVSTMKNDGSFGRRLLQSFPRIVLAVIIAFVISKPLELKIFQSEINAELVTMEQEAYKRQEDAMNTRYTNDITETKVNIEALKSELYEAKSLKLSLAEAALSEADGTGGSQKRNMGPIYKAKKAEADKAAQAYELLTVKLQPQIDRQLDKLASLDLAKGESLEAMNRQSLDGFAAQLDALSRAGRRSDTIFWASIFITLLFICIEITPILAKLMTSRSPYDYVLQKHEHRYAVDNARIVSNLTMELDAELNYNRKTKLYQSNQLATAENELFRDGLAKKVAEEKEKSLTWAEVLRRNRLGLE